MVAFGYRYFREGPLSIGLLGSLFLATVFLSSSGVLCCGPLLLL